MYLVCTWYVPGMYLVCTWYVDCHDIFSGVTKGGVVECAPPSERKKYVGDDIWV